METGIIQEIYASFTLFCFEPKTTLKNKVYFKYKNKNETLSLLEKKKKTLFVSFCQVASLSARYLEAINSKQLELKLKLTWKKFLSKQLMSEEGLACVAPVTFQPSEKVQKFTIMAVPPPRLIFGACFNTQHCQIYHILGLCHSGF